MPFHHTLYFYTSVCQATTSAGFLQAAVGGAAKTGGTRISDRTLKIEGMIGDTRP